MFETKDLIDAGFTLSQHKGFIVMSLWPFFFFDTAEIWPNQSGKPQSTNQEAKSDNRCKSISFTFGNKRIMLWSDTFASNTDKLTACDVKTISIWIYFNPSDWWMSFSE